MMRAVLMLFIAVLLPLSLCACDANTAEGHTPEWSGVYAPTEIVLPDGWYFDQRPTLDYDAQTGVLTVGVHYELPPIDDSGFVPFIYGTAALDAAGNVLYIISENEAEAPSVNADAAAAVPTDTEPLHDGADIWYTKGFSDGTTASVEVLNTAHDAGLWITLTDADGTVLSTVAPAELFGYDISRDIGAQYGGDIFSVQEIALTTDTDGQTLYCILTSEGLAAVYADGRCAWVSDIRGIRAMLTTEAHGLLLLCETRGVQTLTILNADNGHPAETVSPDAGMYTDGDSVTLFSGGAGALYARNRRGIWSLTVAADETGAKTAAGTLLLDYGLSEIAAANVAAAAAPDDKCFYLVLEDDTSEEDERSYLFRYDYVKPEDVVVKEEIVLARLGTHAFLEQVVRDFNQSSDTHRIVIRDYTQYADDEARRRALDTDISSGAIPDLFLIDGSLTDLTDTYSAAGVFADLKPLLQMSPQIEDQEKLTCVKAPFETPLADGTTAQYLLPLSYQICTYVGHPEDFGDAVYASVTAEEMLAFYRRVPEEQYIMQNSFDLQKYLLYANIDAYYSTTRGECTFGDGDLAALMEESQTIYDTAEYLAGDSEFIVPADFHDDFRNGTLRLQRVVITGLPGWVRLKRALGDFTPVGYPNREGKHYASIQGTVLFAASSQTEYREEVCTFLSLWFARNTASMYDSTLLFSSDIDAALAMYADQTFIENGENTGFVNDAHADRHPGLHYKLTQADADSLRAFLNAIDAQVRTDTPAAKILWEEFDARGTKPWSEVFTLAQSRAAIYLSETMD